MVEGRRFLLVCTVKDEGPNILEWVAHHRAIGFTDIVIYENGSSDLTDRALRVMAKAGVIQYFQSAPRPEEPGPPYRNSAYRRAARLPVYAEADWCIALDADEFLCVSAGDGTVADLVAAAGPEADEIRLHWRVFGSSGLRRLDDRLVTERFTMATPASHVTTSPFPVKTLFRPRHYARPGIHLPKACAIPNPVVVTGSGVPIQQTVVRGFTTTDPGAYAFGQVNHYMVRDSETFLIRSARTSSSDTDREVRLAYWKSCNRNFVEDRRLADRSERTRAAMAEIDALTGGRLSIMRMRSLRVWRRRLDELKGEPATRAFYDALV